MFRRLLDRALVSAARLLPRTFAIVGKDPLLTIIFQGIIYIFFHNNR